MRFAHRDAVEADLPRIVEIYNFAVATRDSSCDLEPTTVAARRESFSKHSPGHRPLWVAEVADAPEHGVVGYLGFFHFMNERPGYFITADLAIYLHPDFQNKRLGTYLDLFTRHGFERWGFMPRVARLENTERDLVMMGLRLA